MRAHSGSMRGTGENAFRSASLHAAPDSLHPSLDSHFQDLLSDSAAMLRLGSYQSLQYSLTGAGITSDPFHLMKYSLPQMRRSASFRNLQFWHIDPPRGTRIPGLWFGGYSAGSCTSRSPERVGHPRFLPLLLKRNVMALFSRKTDLDRSGLRGFFDNGTARPRMEPVLAEQVQDLRRWHGLLG